MSFVKTLLLSPVAAFAGFAVLIAMRDISAELLLNEDPVSLAFLVSSVIVALSIIMVLVSLSLGDLLRKLKKPQTIWRAAVLGCMSGAIYGGLFYLIDHMGAGLFNLIDYGLIPIVTAAIGIFFFGERLRGELILASGIYVLGLVFLMWGREMFGYSLIFFAIFCPVATAASDGFTKWLLDPEKGALSRPQLLIVRFFPAAVALALFAEWGTGKGIEIENWSMSLFVAVAFGWAPLWLLCTGLGRAGLAKLATYEFVIPGIAFFGTLPWRWEENARLFPIVGAILVLLGMVVAESRILSRRGFDRSQKLNEI